MDDRDACLFIAYGDCNDDDLEDFDGDEDASTSEAPPLFQRPYVLELLARIQAWEKENPQEAARDLRAYEQELQRLRRSHRAEAG